MTARLDYRWHLRQVMAAQGMFSTTDLLAQLAQRGIVLSSSQVYRLVVDRPERLSLKILMALLDILDCSMDDLIEPVPAAGAPGKSRKTRAVGGGSAVGELRPKRARIIPPGQWWWQGGGLPGVASHLAGRAVTGLTWSLTLPRSSSALVCGIEPGVDLVALEDVVARAGGGRVKLRRLAQALAERPAVLTDGRSPAPRSVGDLLIALRKAGATTVSPPVCAATGCGKPLPVLHRRGQDWYCVGCTRTWEPCTGCGKTRKVNTGGRDGQADCQFCGPREAVDPS